MPQSLAEVHLHIVYSTKDRRPFLADRELRERVFAYLAGVCENHQSHACRIGGVADHVHIHCRLGRTISIADLVREQKRGSSLKLHEWGIDDFAWQVGYGAFSIGPSQSDALDRYIDGQETRHQRVSFQDEFRAMLRKYGVEFDERYDWD